jgi:putative acetyltransferase
MSDDDKTHSKAGDEAFFSRWSRRKRQAATDAPERPPSPPVNVAPAPDAQTPRAAAETGQAESGAAETRATEPGAGRPRAAEDFKDVDFTKLDYQSDYGRFFETGVPEGVRQKALTQLWQSDQIFTQVDPFQDYAGDFTDAATVPLSGVKTAYRVGQGFLSDDEARTWQKLGQGEVSPAIAALPVLAPGYRVRPATTDDAEALAALQAAAIRATAPEAYGREIAESWATGLTPNLMAERIAAPGAVIDVAIHDDSGVIAAMIAHASLEIHALHVLPGHGRRGLARRLIERTIAALESPGARGAITVVASRLSQPLFDRQGFRVRGSMAHTTRGGLSLDLVDMCRPIMSDASFAIAPETPDQPAVRAFFAASETYMAALYPAESNHFVDAAMLARPDVVFLVAQLDREPIGCGAVVKATDGSGEIKRLWVDPSRRGLKIGTRLLEALEAAACSDGVTVLRLETGIHQPEAISLYRHAGFVEIDPFGDYAPDPLSLFMEKRLQVLVGPASRPLPGDTSGVAGGTPAGGDAAAR